MSEPALQDRFHLIGVSGAGMSIVTELLAPRDATVEGSSREESAVLERLRSIGVRVLVGREVPHADPSSVVVVSTATREDNPELAIAHERGQCIIRRSQALALTVPGMYFIGVADVHGRATTSGILVIGLSACGWDPSMAMGDALPQLGTGAYLGGGDVFVTEADESNGLFLNHIPTIEIVTNAEPDHLDRYHSRKEFGRIFIEFARCMVPGDLLVACAGDEDAIRLAQSAHTEGLRVVTYGRHERPLCIPDVVIADVCVEARGAGASLAWGKLSVSLVLSVPGEHNVPNAAIAWVASIGCNLSPQAIADGLDKFTDATRRFEAYGQVGLRRLFDDYVRHPAEVEAVIREAYVVTGGGDVTVMFQPHLYSRICIFVERFAQALSGADHVVFAGIYGAREDPELGVDSSLILSRIGGAFYVEDMRETTRPATSLTPGGGMCPMMGAGSITRCASDVLGEWKRMEA